MKLVLIALLVSFTLIGSRALAIEEPKFTLVLNEGLFQIRDYQAAVVAEVVVTGDQGEAVSKGFRLLADYIFGGNKRRQSIAMTAPVAQQRTRQEIGPAAPAISTGRTASWLVRFTMPSSYSLDQLPAPNNPKVKLNALPPARFAVERFSGLATRRSVAVKTAELDGFLRTHGLHAIGPVVLAQYDPPWTLWFMRRNEVMIPVAR
jgi:hypothetical protein